LADDNFTIGKNYWQFDPMFTKNPSKVDSMLQWCYANWITTAGDPRDRYADWRVTPPVTWNQDGTPNLNWPPAWDLTYSNTFLQTAGTDGLPLGDLNWYPAAKAIYLANRDQYIAALRDSMTNATDVYIPGDSLSAIITPTTSVEESHDSTIPSEFSLEQNYPNPFNPSTNIEFSLPTSTHVTLEVYNTIGQRVATLVNGKLASGSHSVTWNASNVPSGLYFYKLETKNFSQVRKMILMK
jgi:hypothetical protein